MDSNRNCDSMESSNSTFNVDLGPFIYHFKYTGVSLCSNQTIYLETGL